MAKYRMTFMVEFDTAHPMPAIDVKGSMDNVESIFDLLPTPDDIDKSAAIGSFLLEQVAEAVL